MGSKNDPGNFDCYHNALPDEPMFILLARDPSAPELVQDWATERQRQIDKGWRPKSDQAMVDEAIRCAGYMKHWRVVNNGAWREAHPQPQQADGRGAVIEECAKVCEDLRHDDYSAETSDWSGGTFKCSCGFHAALQQSPTTDNSTNKTWQEDH